MRFLIPRQGMSNTAANVKIFIVLCLLTLVTTSCEEVFAEELSVVLHGRSWHHVQKSSQNEANYGVGLRAQFGDVSFEGGTYKNTYSLWSPYVGVEYLPIKISRVSLGVGGIAAWGYPVDRSELWHGAGLAPFVALRVNIHKAWSLSLRTVPARRGVTALSAGYRFR